MDATGLTSNLSSTRIRFRGDGPPLLPRDGGGVGVIETKVDTLLTASAKGDKDSGSSKDMEADDAFLFRSPAFLSFGGFLVFTILNTQLFHITMMKSQGKGHQVCF